MWKPRAVETIVLVVIATLVAASVAIDRAYNAPTDSDIKSRFLDQRPAFTRLRDMLQQDPGIITLSRDQVNRGNPALSEIGIDNARLSEYRELMQKTGVSFIRYYRSEEPRPGAVFVMWTNGPWRYLNGAVATKGMRYFEPQVPKPQVTEVMPDTAIPGTPHGAYVCQRSEVEPLWYVQFEQQDAARAKDY